ncbi:hypothetical protein DUF29 [Janthinobacterium sp. HH01]|uniref:DUF29 domain-containing protein n=1 Tax=Janthinobacterium sp. HH01 TaxID=1198452 RepID=UPI0002AE840E|nr:DUF29 domain-containing protein [Janthinobacterium sp. HH01]ELX09757.1 hypothetical protein DUF29 [Janthinobacterium sp. HH01]
MGTLYEDDVIAWSEQQAALLRRGQWSQLDIDNIAKEIEDVGHREKKELRSRFVVLLTHLLKWKFQSSRRGPSWVHTIRTQRAAIEDALDDCPSLQTLLDDPQWLERTYRRATRDAEAQTQLKVFPAELPWHVEQVLSSDFWP